MFFTRFLGLRVEMCCYIFLSLYSRFLFARIGFVGGYHDLVILIFALTMKL